MAWKSWKWDKVVKESTEILYVIREATLTDEDNDLGDKDFEKPELVGSSVNVY